MIDKIFAKAPFHVLCAATLILAFSPLAMVRAESPARTVMVMDASRSMWGQIDGVNKVVILQNVLKKAFRQYDGKSHLGLVAYGHRKESGCTDIELIRPLGLLKAADYSAVISKIRPRGSTPISNALKLAAKTSGEADAPSNIILISDGLDNCRGNPCGVAGELKQSRPGLKVHVIAFDRKNREELKSLSCISQATGGTFASATNETELAQALDRAMDRTMNPPKMASSQAPNLLPVAGISQSTPNVPLSSSWQPIANSPNEALPPSEIASQQNMQQIANAVGQNETVAQNSGFSQIAGTKAPVTMRALLVEDGAQITNGIVWRVFANKPSRDGKYQLISTHRDSAPTALLSFGEYLVNAAYGRAHLTKKIKVAGGQALNEKFVLNAGGLRLNAVLATGEPVSQNLVSYTIYSHEQDQFGKRETIMKNPQPGLIVRLNAGIYHVVSKYGNANARVEGDVTVEPGKLTEATINHRAGRVTFKLVLQPGGEALANTSWQIVNEAGVGVKSSAGALPSHILAAGDYSVVARHSGREYKMPFAVKSGDNKQVEVVIQ